jgi:single-strand DNA-binding protein
MNKVILMGRLTRDPDIRYSTGENASSFARYTLAVDRRFTRRDGGDSQQTADFIGCVAFGKSAEFAEKYLHQGTKIAIEGRIQTGSYTNKDGQKVYTTDIVVENQEFAESRNASSGNSGSYSDGRGFGNQQSSQQNTSSIGDGFMNIPDGVEDEGLPFN